MPAGGEKSCSFAFQLNDIFFFRSCLKNELIWYLIGLSVSSDLPFRTVDIKFNSIATLANNSSIVKGVFLEAPEFFPFTFCFKIYRSPG